MTEWSISSEREILKRLSRDTFEHPKPSRVYNREELKRAGWATCATRDGLEYSCRDVVILAWGGTLGSDGRWDGDDAKAREEASLLSEFWGLLP